MSIVIALLIAFLSASAGAFLLAKYLVSGALVAQPTDRSNHTIATPTGGGIALIVGMFAAFAVLLLPPIPQPPNWLFVLAFAFGFSIVGLIDDAREVSPLIRLVVQLLAIWFSLQFLPDDTFLINYFPEWLVTTFTFLAWAGFVNYYNFMDGIDGQTGVETVTLGLGLSTIAAIGIASSIHWVWPLVLTACGAGFLIPNWRPAKIFLGDVGSVPLGYLFGFLLLCFLRDGIWLPVLLLPLYYYLDATLTLIRRSLALKPIWRSHREHSYQRAGHVSDRHDIVVAHVIAANIALFALVLFGEISGYRILALVLGIGVGAYLMIHIERLAGVDVIARWTGYSARDDAE